MQIIVQLSNKPAIGLQNKIPEKSECNSTAGDYYRIIFQKEFINMHGIIKQKQ